MEGGSLLKYGVRHGAAHTRLHRLQKLHKWLAVPFHTVALALAPRTLVLSGVARFFWLAPQKLCVGTM
eukprot:9493119-Pyramimonas_sp.AAC.1